MVASYFGLVDNFLTGLAALAVAASLRSIATQRLCWVTVAASLASFCLLVKPAGAYVMALVGANWLLFVIIVTGPVYRLIGVAPMAKFFALQNVMHQVGAMIASGVVQSSSELTFVPGVVDDNHLAQFTSLQAFADFLKTTHPPQSPGILKDEGYHDIALFVFAINERSLTNFIDLDTPAPSVTVTPVPPQETAPNSFSIYATVIFILLAPGVFLIARRPHLQTKKDSQA